MKKSLALFSAVLFVSLFLWPSQARADVIVITSGSLSVRPARVVSFSFAGQGLAVSNSGGGGDQGSVSARRCFQPHCQAGTSISLNSNFSGELGIGFGAATVNGTFYPTMFYTGEIRFSGSALLPSLDTTSNTFFLDAPFTLSGNLNGFLGNPFISGARGPAIFSTTLSGQGIATLELFTFLRPDGVRTFSFNSITYNFQAAPVPEPTTIFLLGTGLAGLAMRARKRRAAGKSRARADV